MAGPEETADFAALIREFKDRSGLSYGVLAKRLHMSTSTLHRYCNGDAVPTEYAPVERFARLCKATPDELVEAHRRWILADGARQRERKAAAGTATAATPAAPATPAATATAEPGTSTPAPATPSAPTPSPSTPTGTEPTTTPIPTPPSTPEASPSDATETSHPTTPNPGPRNGNRTRRRTTLLTAAAVAVVVAATALVPRLVSGGDDNGDRKQEAGSVTSTGNGTSSATPSSKAKATPSPSSSTSPSDSANPSKSAAAKTGVSATPSDKADGGAATAVPLTVTSRPYAWESPCSQTYLVDEDAAKVPPPPTEQDAPSWVSALGAVSAGSQFLELTVQGTGQETVVLQSLNVRVVQSGSPLAWNAYAMGYIGVGCGGGVPTHSFDVGLDATRPVATPKSGQTGLPYKVSESDPEVLYVTAAAASHDVRWYLELAWTSGTRKGVLRIDDQGKPFHTSGMSGRPQYGYSLDDSEWIPHQAD
ncbi:helix-turn-helix domain-containing protein [Streptomyces sp. NBC_00988]|uniref:helix-turn-helix domain-containing protein n=1 Tax=Streptomyces sp. NBC_00988 TaxID=2903704 RepID=UPI0038632391|nr:helix-turn-helix domain-containing protein [Streptomyces sp. NBC_00988]